MPDAEPLTLERLLALHPWEREPDSVDHPLEWLWSFDLAANAADLWDLMIDTSRFNRALGLNRMEFTERDGLLHGVGRNGGFRQEWIEIPWDWVSERWLVARRIYSKGFARYARVIYRMQRLDADRTRVWVYFGWIPRGWFGRTCIKLGMPSIERGYRKLLEELARAVGDGAPAPYRAPAPALSQEARDRIGSLGRQLIERGLPQDAVDRLVAHVSAADDMDVYRIQVRRLAHSWGIDDERLLRTALHATRLGLLDMSWDVICPHCRGVREEAKTLGDVPERGECAVCDIDFDTDSEAALEITFHVHPSIREVPKLYFCSAEPSTKAHIALQIRVAPGDEQVVETSMVEGRYRLRLKGAKEYGFVDVDPEADESTLRWSASALPDTVRLALRPSLTLVNDGSEEVTFVVEEVAWTDDALRPVDLFNFQEFRDLFSEEYVATDVQLSVGEQTVLFTDIVGSTRFYADRGDPSAFMEVKRHFVEVYEEVRNHHGAVVKTIGDAAMASFSNPVEALKASLAIHRRFHADRDDTPIRLRISLNTGPCIAVRLNSNIDYFGTTVNVAAKLQACCEAGEIALSQATYEAPGVRDYLASVSADLNELTYEVKALGQTVQVWQWNTGSLQGGVTH